jgi:tetratricopeptide (TPR) repeat protein
VEQADRELAIEVYGTAAENGHHMGAFGLMMIEAHLMARDYAAVDKFCAQIAGENPPWLANFDPQLNYLRLAAARGQGRFDIAALHLGRLQESRLSGAELLNMAKSLRKLGMNADARKLLEAALPKDPGNEEILALALEIDMDTGRETGFVDNAGRLLELRRPSYELLARIRKRLTSARFIFEEDRTAVLANLDNVLKDPDQALR